MKLFVHIGTNKTGSSYLQSTITLNKEKLRLLGFYVPDSKWDDSMLKGVITPGNGHELAKILVSPNRITHLKQYFKNLNKEANRRNSHSIFLSNEIIIRIFSDQEILEQFETLAVESGIEKIELLVYVRNLYEHALSLYKHRSKYGKFPEYESWFEQDYETLRLFAPFLKNIQNSKCTVTFVPFEKNSHQITTHLLNWLNLNSQDIELFKSEVNKSLTLNQIRWIEHLNKQYEGIAPKLHSHLVKLNKAEENDRLLQQFYKTAQNHFNQYLPTIEAIKEKLESEHDETIDVMPKLKTNNFANDSNLLTFEEFQVINSIAKRHAKFHRINIWLAVTNESAKNFIFKIRGRKKNHLENTNFGGSLRY